MSTNISRTVALRECPPSSQRRRCVLSTRPRLSGLPYSRPRRGSSLDHVIGSRMTLKSARAIRSGHHHRGVPPASSARSAWRVSPKHTSWSRVANTSADSSGVIVCRGPKTIASGPRVTATGIPAINGPPNLDGTGGMTRSVPATPNGTTSAASPRARCATPE